MAQKPGTTDIEGSGRAAECAGLNSWHLRRQSRAFLARARTETDLKRLYIKRALELAQLAGELERDTKRKR